LARRSQISDSHISRLVAGGRKPGNEAAKAIARAFRLPPEEVMRQAGLLPPKNANLSPGDRRALVETMDKIAMLSPDAQRLIADLVDKVWRSEQR
jgi:transcriptional regulator with XRE-family HTH domain